MQIGDYVEVDIGMGLCAKGKIVTEHYYDGDLSLIRKGSGRQTYKIKFLDSSTHTAMPSELRKLSEKESFVLKLKGGEDKEMARIYEALDERT